MKPNKQFVPTHKVIKEIRGVFSFCVGELLRPVIGNHYKDAYGNIAWVDDGCLEVIKNEHH